MHSYQERATTGRYIMSQVQRTVAQPYGGASRMSTRMRFGLAMLASAFIAIIVLAAFVAVSALRTPTAGISTSTVQSVDGWEKALLQARTHRVQAIQDGWEQPLLGARLARAQAIQDGWEPVLLAQQAARIARAQSIQDAWEVALFR